MIINIVHSVFVKRIFNFAAENLLVVDFSVNADFVSGVYFGCVFIKQGMPLKADFFVFIQNIVCYEFANVAPNNIHIAVAPKIVAGKFFCKNLAVSRLKKRKIPGRGYLHGKIVGILNTLFKAFKRAVFNLNIFGIIIFCFIVRKQNPINCGVCSAAFEPQLHILRQCSEIRHQVAYCFHISLLNYRMLIFEPINS